MKATRPSASRRWSRAASRAWIAANGQTRWRRPFRPATLPSAIASRFCRRMSARLTRSSRPTPTIPATNLRKPIRRSSESPRISAAKRFGPLGGRAPAPVIFEPERAGQALLCLASGDVGGERLAINNHREDASVWADAFEFLDLRIGPARDCGRRRAEDDEEARSRQRLADLRAEVVRGRELLKVPEDGRQAARDGAMLGHSPDEMAGDAEALECLMQPFGGLLIAVAVAQEREVMSGSPRERLREDGLLIGTSPLRRSGKYGHAAPENSAKRAYHYR